MQYPWVSQNDEWGNVSYRNLETGETSQTEPFDPATAKPWDTLIRASVSSYLNRLPAALSPFREGWVYLDLAGNPVYASLFDTMDPAGGARSFLRLSGLDGSYGGEGGALPWRDLLAGNFRIGSWTAAEIDRGSDLGLFGSVSALWNSGLGTMVLAVLGGAAASGAFAGTAAGAGAATAGAIDATAGALLVSETAGAGIGLGLAAPAAAVVGLGSGALDTVAGDLLVSELAGAGAGLGLAPVVAVGALDTVAGDLLVSELAGAGAGLGLAPVVATAGAVASSAITQGAISSAVKTIVGTAATTAAATVARALSGTSAAPGAVAPAAVSGGVSGGVLLGLGVASAIGLVFLLRR